MGLIERARAALSGEVSRAGNWGDLDAWWQDAGGWATFPSVQTTLGGNVAEKIGQDFVGLAQAGYRSNGIIFACMLLRHSVFSATRFQFQRLIGGRPSELFGDPSLALLEEPWPGGTTQDLLARVLNDADLAGNSFNTTETSLATLGGDGGKTLVRLRPDWVSIALGRRASGLGLEKIGLVYQDGGWASGNDQVMLLPEEVAHFAPVPDPLASYRGMSWLTPIVRQIQADGLMTTHQRRFFENGATPNMIVKHPAGASEDSIRRFKAMLDASHAGASNAYKTLHLYPGADATVVGANFQQLEFAVTQSHGETRIAAAAGTPPLLVGLSGGMEAAQYANYGPTRRRFADGTVHPLWQNVAGSFAPLLPDMGKGTRLWYDGRDVPFLREDEKDAAEIQQVEASTIRTLVDGGYTPESVMKAVLAGDLGLLKHSGLYSVQLQAAGAPTAPQPTPTTGAPDA